MSRLRFSDAEFAGKRKVMRREKFLAEMERAVPWKIFADLVEPHYPKAGNGRRPYPLEVMLRIHFMQQWSNLSDRAMEAALYDTIRNFAKLSLTRGSIPDETTILNFRHLLEKHDIAADTLEAANLLLADRGIAVRRGTIIGATIIEAPSSTKNVAGARDPEMRQTKKGNRWHFGVKAHIGAGMTGLVHTVEGVAANVLDVTQAHALLHGENWCWVMLATEASRIGGRIRGATYSGTVPCAQANAARWARATWGGCWNPINEPRPACAPEWSIRFE